MDLMLDDIHSALKERWFELYPQFSVLREQFLSRVTRWEWTNGERYDPRPLYFKRGHVRGRTLRHIPTDKYATYGRHEYGFDSDGRVVVDRDHQGGAVEAFHDYTTDFIERTIYQSYYKALRAVEWLYLNNGVPTHFASLWIVGSPEDVWPDALQGKFNISTYEEEYVYAGGRLELIKWKRRNDWRRSGQFNIAEGEYHFEYDVKGSLTRITDVMGGGTWTRTTYRKREPGETARSITIDVEQRLFNIIPQLVADAKFKEPLYCLQFLYYHDNRNFPPRLFPGFESRRQRILETGEPKGIPHYVWADIWHADEHEGQHDSPLAVTDADTLLACERLEMEIHMYGRYRHGAKVLRRIARVLNQLDWSKITPVTPDFIVYALGDYDLYWSNALRLSGATQQQMEEWRKRGLL
jgi:hypothetical protein